MIVNISSPTHFHVLDLAHQMDRLGVLGRFFTSLPSWRTSGLDSDRTTRNILPLIPLLLARYIPESDLRRGLFDTHREFFSKWLADAVTPCDVFHSLSGFGIAAHQRARNEFGSLIVCDRGSSHILFQDQLLREEYQNWGQPYPAINIRAIETELSEYEFCDLITVPSSFSFNSFIQMGVVPEKIAKIPYGVDLSQFKPQAKIDNKFRILFVGNLCFRKGIPYLLKALDNLNLPDFEITFIGTLSPEIQPFIERFHGNLKCLGAKPKQELPFYYSQASVFVLPSIEEGLALVQAQALACGLPVISTANTGAEDLFTDGQEGFIVPIRDTDAIREKIFLLYENDYLRQEMSQAALLKVKENGGWDQYGQNILDVYQNHYQIMKNKS